MPNAADLIHEITVRRIVGVDASPIAQRLAEITHDPDEYERVIAELLLGG